MPKTYFSPATFRFLRALARNNNRGWFKAHQDDYETHVRGPYLELIADLQKPLAKISTHFRADPRKVGGSLFRIQRDVRFAGDKQPYKTWAGARFFHERRREVAAPSFYLHIKPGDCFVGGGIWHPESPTLKKLRAFIADNPAAWKRAARSRAFRERYEFWGESLTRTAGLRPFARTDRRSQAKELRRRRGLRRCVRLFAGAAAFRDRQLQAPGAADRLPVRCARPGILTRKKTATPAMAFSPMLAAHRDVRPGLPAAEPQSGSAFQRSRREESR